MPCYRHALVAFRHETLLSGRRRVSGNLCREGKVVRHKEGRKTFRFEFEGKAYYAKAHAGIGWSEIFKNLITCKWPVIDASNEWHAIRRLNQVGVPTAELVGYGARGWNPARRQSFVLMRELKEQVELEAFFLHMGAQGAASHGAEEAVDSKSG